MRQIVVLGILLLAMLLLKILGVAQAGGVPLFLASVGFVILAAHSTAEIVGRFGLPKVTGYIIAGVLLGPGVGNILSPLVVENIKMFSTLALGLIALNAGLELHIDSLRQISKTLMTTIALKVGLLGILVGGGFFIVQNQFQIIQTSDNMADLALALVFAALAIGTSPAIALAVTKETNSESRMSHLVLGMAVAKDVVVVLVLALVLALAAGFLEGEVTSHGDVLLSLVGELGLSLLAGVVLGVLLILYLHFIRREMLLFVAATILGVAELSVVFKLELLLVFIVAGMVVRNFSKWEEELHRPLHKISLPVFIVFFTNAGAALDLRGVGSVGALVVLLFALRVGAYYLASRWGGKLSGESTLIVGKSWLAYLPQAGVTLGLVGVAAHELPALAESIEPVGLGMVALNLLIGPIALRKALELTSPKVISRADRQEETAALSSRSSEMKTQVYKGLDISSVKDEDIRRQLEQVITELEGSFEQLVKSRLKPLVDGVIEDLRTHVGSKGVFNKEILSIMEEQTCRLRQRVKVVLSLYEKQDSFLLRQSSVVLADYHSEHYRWQKGDGWILRLQKSFLNLKIFFNFHRNLVKREVPVQSVLRYHLCPVLSNYCWTFSNNWERAIYQVTEEVRKAMIIGNVEEVNLWGRCQEILDIVLERAISDFRFALTQVSRPLCWSLNSIGSPLLSSDEIRFSYVEPEVSKNLRLCEEDVKIWEEKFIYIDNTLRAHLMTGHIQKVVDEIIEDRCLSPLEEAKGLVSTICGELKKHLSGVSKQLENLDLECQVDIKALEDELRRVGEDCVRRLKFRSLSLGSYRLLNRDLTIAVGERLSVHESEMEILSEGSIGLDIYRPHELGTIKVNLDNNFHESVLIEVLPLIESRMEKVSGFNEALAVECEDVLNVLEYSLETVHESGAQTFDKSKLSAIGAAQHSIEKIAELEKEFLEHLAGTEKSVHELIAEANIELWKGLHRAGVMDSASTRLRGVQGWFAQRLEVYRLAFNDYFQRWGFEFKRGLKFLKSHHAAEDMQYRIRTGRLDARSVRHYLEEQHFPTCSLELPKLYQRLFSLDPLQDRRFFSVHRRALDFILGDRVGLQMGRRILVTAEPGMGRTSLLNICQLEFPNARIVRMEQDVYQTATRLLSALGAELGTDTSINNLLRELRRQNMVIMVDNLDNWLQPGGYEVLERFFDLVVRAPENVTWIATLRDPNYDLFQRVFDLRTVFTEVIYLESLDMESLRRVVYDRHKLSGLEIEFASALGLDRIKRIWKTGDEHLFFRTLLNRSQGNLKLALMLWMKSLEGIVGDRLKVSVHRSLAEGFGFLDNFSENSKIVLKELYRYGPRTIGQLRESLVWDVRVLRRELNSLEATGLVIRRDKDGRIYQIPSDLTFSVGEHFQHSHWL